MAIRTTKPVIQPCPCRRTLCSSRKKVRKRSRRDFTPSLPIGLQRFMKTASLVSGFTFPGSLTPPMTVLKASPLLSSLLNTDGCTDLTFCGKEKNAGRPRLPLKSRIVPILRSRRSSLLLPLKLHPPLWMQHIFLNCRVFYESQGQTLHPKLSLKEVWER